MSGWTNAADSLSLMEERRADAMERERAERRRRIGELVRQAKRAQLLGGLRPLEHAPNIRRIRNRATWRVACACGWQKKAVAYSEQAARIDWAEHVEDYTDFVERP